MKRPVAALSAALVPVLAFVGSIPVAAQEATALPGRQLDVPVDIDGDGESTRGDVYLFNWWLEEGGSLEDALSGAEISGGGVIDLSSFFASDKARIASQPEEPQDSAAGGGGVALQGGGCVPPPEAPHHTRRMPPQTAPAGGLTQDVRTTPDARFMVFSSRAGNLPGANGLLQVYRFEQGASSTDGTLVHASRTNAGAPANADCRMPSISNDGRQVAFHTAAQLVPNDTDIVEDVYFVDLENPSLPVTTRVSGPRLAGVRGSSYGAAIAGGGGFIAFTSAASDLVVDTNGTTRDVLRFNMATGALELAGVENSSPTPIQSAFAFSTIGDELGCPAPVSGLGVGSVISDDGSRVVFCGRPCDWESPDLCPSCPGPTCLDCVNDPDCTDCASVGSQQVYLRDFVRAKQGATATFLVSVRPCIIAGGCVEDVAGDDCSRRPSLSGDGSRIAFSSLAKRFRTDELFVDPDGLEDVFFIDVETVINVACVPPARVSVVLCGASNITDGHSFQPMLSADGTRIAFASDSTRLLPGSVCSDTNGVRDVFVRQTTAPATTRRFSVSSAGVAGNGASMNPDLTGDGRVGVYQSAATNLIASDTNAQTDVFQTLSPGGPFIRGDANLNGRVELADAVIITTWLFQGGLTPVCYDAADVDDGGFIDLSDAVYISSFLFSSGMPPFCPFSCLATTSCCGNDPTGDGLPCGSQLANCVPFAADGSCSRCP